MSMQRIFCKYACWSCVCLQDNSVSSQNCFETKNPGDRQHAELAAHRASLLDELEVEAEGTVFIFLGAWGCGYAVL